MFGPALAQPVSGLSPKVTVLTTTFNGARFLEETIESVLNQTLTDFEFLIIDDGSSDGTPELVQRYADPRIRLLRNERNLGIGPSRNFGFRQARGEFIATLDQDDVCDPRRLELQVRHLEQNPRLSAVGSRVWLLENGVPRPDPMPVHEDAVLVHFALFFGRHNTTYSSLCLRRRDIVEHNLFFDTRYSYAEDFELCSRIAEGGGLACLPDALVSYRLHAQNNSKLHYEEMATNGMKFMTNCHARLLGRQLEATEGRRLWNGLVIKIPPATQSELRELGLVISELATKFVARYATNRQQASQIWTLASVFWHQIVDRTVRSHGLGFDRVRFEFEPLCAWRPSRLERLRTQARGVLSQLRARLGPGVSPAPNP